MSTLRKTIVALFLTTFVGAGVGFAASLDVDAQKMAFGGATVNVPEEGATVTQTATGGAVNTPHTTTAKIDSGTPTFSGSLTFTLFPSADCTGSPAATAETITVNGNDGATFTSSPVTPTTAGTYSWHAAYSGDAVNTPGTSCVSINVTAASATTSISQVALGGTAGTNHTSTATLSGGQSSATGTIVFTLYTGNVCGGTVIGTSTSTVAGANGVQYTSAPQVPPTAGMYSWKAVYSGDANHAGATQCFSITVSAPLIKVRMGAITLVSKANQNQNFWNARIEVTVRDQAGAVVSGVLVTGAWSPTALASTESSCTTDAAGKCQIYSGNNAFPSSTSSQTWTVTNLTRSGYTYDATLNTQTSLTVTKP